LREPVLEFQCPVREQKSLDASADEIALGGRIEELGDVRHKIEVALGVTGRAVQKAGGGDEIAKSAANSQGGSWLERNRQRSVAVDLALENVGGMLAEVCVRKDARDPAGANDAVVSHAQSAEAARDSVIIPGCLRVRPWIVVNKSQTRPRDAAAHADI